MSVEENITDPVRLAAYITEHLGVRDREGYYDHPLFVLHAQEWAVIIKALRSAKNA